MRPLHSSDSKPSMGGAGTKAGGKDLEVEILVHAFAPSRGKDDCRYRALAKAYLNFEPAGRWRLLEDELEDQSFISDRELDALLQQDCMSQDSNDNPCDNEQPNLQPCVLPRKSDTSITKSGPPSESPQISFDGALDSFNSPPLRLLKSVDVLDNEASSLPPQHSHEVLAQSPVERSVPDLPSSEMALELCLQHLNASQSSWSGASTAFVPSSPLGVTLRGPISQTTKRLSLSPPQEKPLSDASLLQSPATTHSPKSSLSPTRLRSKRRRIEFISPDTTLKSEFLVQNTPIESQRPTISSSPVLHQPRTIYPPPPEAPTDSLTPQSLITPHLRHLANQLSLQFRYRPKSQSRPLRSFERGYWSVSTQEWQEGFSTRVWNFLAIYVGGGRAGWGVWARREEAANCLDSMDGYEELRVYCWGEVVGHIYLLLYLASEREIKGKGARWVDGEGKVIITMGG